LDFNNFSDEFLIAKKWLRQSNISVDHFKLYQFNDEIGFACSKEPCVCRSKL